MKLEIANGDFYEFVIASAARQSRGMDCRAALNDGHGTDCFAALAMTNLVWL